MKSFKFLPLLMLFVVILVAAGCQSKEVEVTREVEKEVEVTRVVKETVVQEVEVTRQVEVPVEMEPAVEVPFEELWASSGHADVEAEAFRHWDEDDPKEVPTACAKCHSTPGYLDFIGADGTEAGVVDSAAPVGTTVECAACHNDVTLTMDSVVMPSGVEITSLGREARCMQCHQGRESTVSVNASIEEAGVEDDTISEDLGFRNIHYFAAAATKYGTMAKGGYEYEGKAYDANFAHVDSFDTCVECHNPHTLQVRVDQCSACHAGVTSVEDLKDVRMPGSQVDYDGDGDVTEGIYYELEGLREVLYQAIQAYAADTAGTPIVYNPASHPYFFIDANADGAVDEGDTDRYASWTPRLLKAAYNYQVSVKDPGAFAHGGKYIIELLYDSIEDLNPELVEGLQRIDHGHFAGSEEAFRHWDEEGEVSASCAKCHSATGLPVFLKEGVNVAEPLSNGFQCTTCHNDLSTFTRYEVPEVEFPSGAVIDSGNQDMNLCMNCHQGRASTASVNGRIASAGVGDDEVSDALGFINVHYFAAGATRFGTEAQGAYEYEGKEYVGLFAHVPDFSNCTDCHNTHALVVRVEACSGCHPSVASAEDLDTIRIDPTDWDGDGDVEEGIAGEVATMQEALYAAMQDYAANTIGTGIEYNAARYPYFFDDAGEQFAAWTPSLLRAAYNYQYAAKDPGGFAHNGKYILQVLYDGLEDLGGDLTGMTRP